MLLPLILTSHLELRPKSCNKLTLAFPISSICHILPKRIKLKPAACPGTPVVCKSVCSADNQPAVPPHGKRYLLTQGASSSHTGIMVQRRKICVLGGCSTPCSHSFSKTQSTTALELSNV